MDKTIGKIGAVIRSNRSETVFVEFQCQNLAGWNYDIKSLELVEDSEDLFEKMRSEVVWCNNE